MKIAKFIASGGGSGFLPKAPGTWGSVVGLLVVLVLAPFPTWLYLLAVPAAFLKGLWATNECLKDTTQTDPQWIVTDEVCGMLVTFLFIPTTPLFLASGFLLFRLFDVWKPAGIRRVEQMHGGLGVMLDDVLAGVGANLILQVLRLVA